MDIQRRTVLKGASASGVLAAALSAGMLRPTQVFAADRNKAAFEAKDTPAAMKAAGAGSPAESKDLVLKAPDIAENGAVVPIDIISKIPNTVSLSVFVDKNPFPLVATFDLSNGAEPDISIRAKMGTTSAVRAVAKTSDGKFYTTSKEVKVTAGGCGG
jgi:sulfur-oxidizing protein SoxY